MNSDVKQLAFSLIYIEEMLEKLKTQNSLQTNEAKLEILRNAETVLESIREQSVDFLFAIEEKIKKEVSDLFEDFKEETVSSLKEETSAVHSIGFTGSSGERGPIGFVGSSGSKGDSGPIGFTGSFGATGFTGSVGERGAQGFTGSSGFTGSFGAAGFAGSQGIQGFTGSFGATGFVGSQGIQGFTGSTGDKGIIGFTGSIGFVGSQGITGFVGSQGHTGFTGSFGATGFVGSRGEEGYVGSQGSKGDTGFTGSIGERGFTGFTGSSGIKGDSGSIGFTGSFGATGFVGSQGIQGIIGFTGSAGKDGKGFNSDEFERLRQDYTMFKNLATAQLSSIGGGGSTKIMDNDDVVFQRRHEIEGDAILIYDKDINKFRSESMLDILERLKIGLEVQYDKLVFKTTSGGVDYTYVGEAAPGTSAASALWRIKRVADYPSGLTEIIWADDTDTFDKVWNDRETYSYGVS